MDVVEISTSPLEALSPIPTASGHRHHHGRFGIPVDFLCTIPTTNNPTIARNSWSTASWPIKFIPSLHPNSAPLFSYLFLTGKLVGVLMLASRLACCRPSFVVPPRELSKRRLRPSFLLLLLLTHLPLDYSQFSIFRWEIIRPRALPEMPRHRRAHRM